MGYPRWTQIELGSLHASCTLYTRVQLSPQYPPSAVIVGSPTIHLANGDLPIGRPGPDRAREKETRAAAKPMRARGDGLRAIHLYTPGRWLSCEFFLLFFFLETLLYIFIHNGF